MTRMELDEQVNLSMQQVRVLLGRLTRPDGKPLARGTVLRYIQAGLPCHQITARSRCWFVRAEVEAFVCNRWNRQTPDGESVPDPARVA
jgi:hypothetical protein